MVNMSSTESICVVENGDVHPELTDQECQDIVDPHCTAANPYRVTFQDITAAAFLIKNGIEYTPCTVSYLLFFLFFLILLNILKKKTNLECYIN